MQRMEGKQGEWTLMSLLVLLLTASVITFAVYQGGRLLGFS